MSSTRWMPLLLAGLFAPTPAQAAPADEAFFEKKVRPLLLSRCADCHSPRKTRGGLRLDSRAGLLTGGDSGPAVVPGKPEESLLVRAVRHGEQLKMPPRDKLSQAEVAILVEWVKRGVPWPESRAPVTPPSKTVGERVLTAEEKAFWAFRPVRAPAPPRTRNVAWARNPIDPFVLARLEAAGLNPAPEADRLTLFRRLAFDLTGLPPTMDEVRAFLRDDRPDAYERAVDRLLASPAHGERWGRRWLDVARYADSNGMDENLAHAFAWRYRDWVVRNLNADRPYDRFVRDQLAGDLLPAGSDAERADQLTATGFLVIGPKMLAEDDPVKMRMDIIDEQLDTIGQSILGLTLGCARCHDHKFDPITMADYYGLAGIFYSTRTMQKYSVVAQWLERPIATPAILAALAAHDAKVAQRKNALAEAEKEAREAASTRVAEERKRAKEYTTTAAEVRRRGGVLKLVHADPGKDLPPGGIRIEAEAFARGNVLKDRTTYGAGIGVVVNAGPIPNVAEYDVVIPRAGSYQLALRYAAANPRPVRVLVDGRLVRADAASKATGSWFPDTQTWYAEAVLTLSAGKRILRLERNGPFPHIDRLALLPMTPEQVAAAPLSVGQAASERKLLASILGAHLSADGRDDPFRLTREVEAELAPTLGKKVQQRREELAALEKTRPAAEHVMAVEDDRGQNLRIHLRGNHLTLGAETPRRFPRILGGEGGIGLDAKRSGRRELAEWMTREDHPLTARVIANRIWLGHFGAGLVRSADNFGRLGERPSHPELLDWLAEELVRSGWSLKHLHRLIVTSAAYRMSTRYDAGSFRVDPDNRLLWRFNRRRLEAEELRDGMLAVAGLLDRAMGGSLLTVRNRQYVTGVGNRNYEDYASTRRSLYLPVVRSAVYDVLQTFDFPDPSVPAGARATTTIPTQALLLLNSSLVDQAAEAFARLLLAGQGEDDDRVREAYRRAHGREPTVRELERVRAYLTRAEQVAQEKTPPAARRLLAWRGLCRVLLASSEFLFVE